MTLIKIHKHLKHFFIKLKYQFLMATGITYPLIVYKNIHLFSYFLELVVQNQFTALKSRRRQGHTPLGGPRGESFSLPLPAPTGCLHSLARGTSLHLQVNSSAFTLLWPLPPSSHLLWFWSSFFLLRVLCCTAAAAAAAAAKSLQSCPTLCDPIDSGPPGSPSLGCMDPP